MNPFDELLEFNDNDGVKHYFVKCLSNSVMVWKDRGHGRDGFTCTRLDLTNVDKETLKQAKVWRHLDDKFRQVVERVKKDEHKVVKERMKHARNSKRRSGNKYPGVPETLTCACGYTTPCVKSVFVKKAEKLGLTPQELADQYKCQKCNPTKGRKKKSV